jgi:hypothetical protein
MSIVMDLMLGNWAQLYSLIFEASEAILDNRKPAGDTA